MAWIDALGLDELTAKGKAVVRHEGRQILLLHGERGVFACANRCPHEGYPLSEGSLADGCVLTCNWHNWKFDLASGATLVGGDACRAIRFASTPGALAGRDAARSGARRQSALHGVAKALEDCDQQRLVRETARLVQAGADPAEAVAVAVAWMAERLEFGTTHAIAGAPDWLRLSDNPASATSQQDRWRSAKSWATSPMMRAPDGTFRSRPARRPWNETAFLDAIEMKTSPRRSLCCAARWRPGAVERTAARPAQRCLEPLCRFRSFADLCRQDLHLARSPRARQRRSPCC